MKMFLLLMLITFCHPVFAQESLYLPLEFQRAYEIGTRSKDGNVPDGHWQNRAIYDIEASIDVPGRIFTCSAAITYFNNSPYNVWRSEE